ncbi:hypothetical protein MMC30_000647 [Trapelia coarctata]|nr:hypothetical protein [Trapelia coarctata]
MITLNPLVQSYALLPSPEPTFKSSSPKNPNAQIIAQDWDAEYEVTDLVSYLPFHLWDSKVTFRAKFKATEEGMESLVNAPGGVVSDARWWVQEAVDGSLVLEETAEVSCHRALARTVKGQMRESHGVLAGRFLERLEERRVEEKGKGGGKA